MDTQNNFIRYVANAYSEDMGINFQIVDALNPETALKVLEVIKPEFPDCTFSVTRYANELSGLSALKCQQERLNDVLGYVATCESPGDTFLQLIGYRQQSTEG